MRNPEYFEFEEVRKSLIPVLVKEPVEDAVITEIDGFKVGYKLILTMEVEDDRMVYAETTTVTNKIMDSWEIDRTTLHASAYLSAQQRFPATFVEMGETLGLDSVGTYILTNSIMWYGSAVIFYIGELEKIRRKLGEDFFILPSSVDELLIMPDSLGGTKEELETMVKDINRDVVSPEKRLADRVWHYSDRGLE